MRRWWHRQLLCNLVNHSKQLTLNWAWSCVTLFASTASTQASLVISSSIPKSNCRMSLINVSTRCCVDSKLSVWSRERSATSSNADVNSVSSACSFSRNLPYPAASVKPSDIWRILPMLSDIDVTSRCSAWHSNNQCQSSQKKTTLRSLSISRIKKKISLQNYEFITTHHPTYKNQ